MRQLQRQAHKQCPVAHSATPRAFPIGSENIGPPKGSPGVIMPALVTWMEKAKTHLTVINNQDTDRHIGRLVLIDTLLLYPVPERVNFKGQKVWWF